MYLARCPHRLDEIRAALPACTFRMQQRTKAFRALRGAPGGQHVIADLPSGAIQNETARRLAELEQRGCRLSRRLPGNELCRRRFERADIRGEPRGLCAFACGDALAQRCGERVHQAGSGLGLDRLDARAGKERALHEVDVAFERDQGVALRGQAAHQDQLARLVEQRNEARQDAFNMRMLASLCKDAAVKRDDVGAQIPHAVNVRVLGAKAVQRDEEAGFAQRVDDLGKARRFAAGLLGHFEHHALRRQAQRLQAGEQRVAIAGIHQRGRMEAQEEPFVVTVERVEVAEVQRLGQSAKFKQVASARGLGENLVRRHLLRMLVVRTQRGVIADRAPVRDGEDWLKHAENGVCAVKYCAPRAFVAGHWAGRLEAGRIEFDHAHHVSRVGGGEMAC
ncbi:hypothetical protein BUPH_03368 [Paraburkholderia phenoliruptrix BR3459a]|uniref:Uncharacterized protein n=1 Tax=Paraburkholderia phenoliruptrix BR3459a TaxID=1229205 RepID=K0DUJ5_9BURK|nr:hypothetical protein BUPH_03368 [Paraburkholderia phenoliruptrix BR3459a]